MIRKKHGKDVGSLDKKIVCIYTMGLREKGIINIDIIEYRNDKDMLEKLDKYIKEIENKEDYLYINKCM